MSWPCQELNKNKLPGTPKTAPLAVIILREKRNSSVLFYFRLSHHKTIQLVTTARPADSSSEQLSSRHLQASQTPTEINHGTQLPAASSIAPTADNAGVAITLLSPTVLTHNYITERDREPAGRCKRSQDLLQENPFRFMAQGGWWEHSEKVRRFGRKTKGG